MLHPGSIAGTELGREAPLELFVKMGFCDEKGNMLPEVAASLKTIPQGVATTIWCATSPLLNDLGGVYCEDVNIATLIEDALTPNGAMSYSVDETNAMCLWKLTEELTGIIFNIKSLFKN